MDGAKQIFLGNLFLIGCAVFYLIWWLRVFHPAYPRNAGAAGLLAGAFASGMAAVVLIIRGGWGLPKDKMLFPGYFALIGWIALYAILLAISTKIAHRPVTAELFLITGWAALTASQINALYALDVFSRQSALLFLMITAAMFAVSFVCYMAYYRLNVKTSYIVGAVPLLMVGAGGALMMIRIALRG